MPVTTEIDAKAGVVVNRAAGPLSLSEIKVTLEEIFGNREFQPGMGFVWDVRGGAIDAISSREIRGLADFVARRLEARGSGRLAIVVSTDLAYGIGRMVDGYAGALPIEREVFLDFEKAVRWAGLSPPQKGEGT